MQTTTNTAWDDFARTALAKYDEALLRAIAARLFKPRNQWPVDELIERTIETFTNPPVIDRRVRELPESARQLLAVLARTRQPRWHVGQLLAIVACLGHHEGLAPVTTLLDTGFLLADLNANQPEIKQWEDWLGVMPMTARVVVHPAVAERAIKESTGLPTLAGKKFDAKSIRTGDGLEWFLRAGVLWQQLRGGVMRFTQAHTLFKRDLQRLQTDPLLSTSISESPVKGTDLGILALEVAIGMGVMTIENGELRTSGFPKRWDESLPAAITDIWRGVNFLHTWDPEQGYLPAEDSPTGTVAMLAILLLANQPAGIWTHPGEIGGYLFPKHPLWASRVSDGSDDGTSWLEAMFFGWALPSRLVEAAEDGEGWWFRLTDVGRWLLSGAPEPKLDVPFHQGLVVQPNADMIAYRQTLTPSLIGKLSRFAEWKMLGPACTLGLTAESVYRGLESNLTLAEILGTLQKHSAHGMPPNVGDLIRQWAGQRERITVHTSATLLEFNTPAELETAVSRGLVTIRLTDRIGLAEGEIDYKHVKQVGNRDYESPPQQCVMFDEDGVTFGVDISSSDLLLEAELARLAEQLPSEDGDRRYRITPASARAVREQGLTLPDFEQWCVNRGGEPLSPAARLLFAGSNGAPASVRTRLVVEFASQAVADGVCQWPDTAPLLGERLGPAAVSIDPANLDQLREKLAPIGVVIIAD
ncbi:helicase-associated domain-containing protein [Zavarzinella formosa]|uniref:helicase-associated domain-containing protein n=1 Tax=Zavarzinella formosa TaxID=360055 RepID=UPI0002E2E239|nr:helicase-associated domain-containing protein [Zavarzinella formosa]